MKENNCGLNNFTKWKNNIDLDLNNTKVSTLREQEKKIVLLNNMPLEKNKKD